MELISYYFTFLASTFHLLYLLATLSEVHDVHQRLQEVLQLLQSQSYKVKVVQQETKVTVRHTYMKCM